MNSVEVLKSQLTVVNTMYHSRIEMITPEQWVSRLVQDQNLIGFYAWHMTAVQDWTCHVAVRGLPELRMREPWATHPGINPQTPPFGMTLEQADAIALAVTPADLIAYADAVNASIHAWLDGLTDADLDVVPEVEANSRRYPAERITEGYQLEVADMVEWRVWRHLTSPCIGHVRGHFGEIDLLLSMMKAR